MRRVTHALKFVARWGAWAASLLLAVLTVFLVSYFLGWKSVSPPSELRAVTLRHVKETNGAAVARQVRFSRSRMHPEAIAPRLVWRLLPGRDERREKARVTAEIASMDVETVRRAVGELEAAPATRACNELRMLLLLRWAALDPRAAWEYLQTKPTDLFGEVPAYPSFQNALLKRWASSDPLGALQAWQQLDADKRRDRYALRHIFSTLGGRDLDQAFTTLKTLPPQEQQDAYAGLAVLAGRDSLRPTLLQKFMALPPGDSRARALSESLGAWAGAGKLDEAVAWLDSANLNGEEISRAEKRIANTWYHEDPSAAADWLMSRSPSRRAENMEQIVNLWAENDPVACGQWLVQQELGQASRAMRRYADSLAADFPEQALVWARQIAEPAVRQKAIAEVEATLRERYPHRAEELIATAGK